MTNAWQRIEVEARRAALGAGRFPLRAYSELMPPPYVGLEPYAPRVALGGTTDRISDGDSFDLDYCVALTAIETVADTACAPFLP